MVWIWGLLACQGNSDDTPSDGGEPTSAETGTTPVKPTGKTGDTGVGVDICDVPTVMPTGPVVTFDTPPKRVLMLSIDTLRRDFVDFYACEDEPRVSRMPFLSTILAQSVSLEDAQQCSNWTYPSTNCTLSGTLLEEMDHVPRGGLDGRPVPEGQRTLASLLSEVGFFTGLVWTNGWFYRIAGPNSPPGDQLTGNNQGYQALEGPAGGAVNVGTVGRTMLEEALGGADAPERWLLHLHFIEPHDLYNAPDEFMPELKDLPNIPVDFRDRGSFGTAQVQYAGFDRETQDLYRSHFQLRYTGDLRQLDARLEVMWSQLEAGGLLDDTLVVLWTDHGEGFWERGPQAHGWRLGAEENDAIVAFWHPDLTPQRVLGPHHAIDVLPTTLSALGLEVPEDLAGVRAGLASPDRVRFTASPNIAGQRYQAVTKEGFKLTAGWNGTLTLHDRNTDRLERTDLFAADHPRVDELWGLLEPRITMLEERIPEGQRVNWDLLNKGVIP
ncbi:MAG: sulfatase-like hydrolase/transferase [Myxococcota bacterium]